jgi:hypothetical protein
MSAIVNRLIENISKNDQIKIGVAAVMMQGTKQIGNICGNIDRNYCRGLICPSIHAEVNAITSYFGKYISYSQKHGWSQWCIKKAKKFKYYGG